jgi:hypothetical protein
MELQFSYKVLSSSDIKQKNYNFFKTDWTPTAVDHGDSRHYSTTPPLNAMGHNVGPCLRPHGARYIILKKNSGPYIFREKGKM